LLNALVIAASLAVWVELLPPFAKNQAHVSPKGIGLLWAIDSLVVVIAQLPVAKIAEGRRRMRSLALMSLAFGASLLGFDAAGWALTLERALPRSARRTPRVEALPGLAAGPPG